MQNRIMIVWPGIYLGWESLGSGFENSSMNHGLASISAVLKTAGYPCFCVDLRSFKSWDHFDKVIRQQKFDICLVGFLSVDHASADKAIRIVKRAFPSKPIIVGGVHVTFNQLTSFSTADTVVWGEGDEVILDLVKTHLSGKQLPRHVVASVVKNLDGLPVVDRSLFNLEYEKNNPFLPLLEKPFYTVNFSRGCAFSCSFCLESKNLLWKGQRIRSADKCIDELESIARGGIGIGSLMIHDDSFPSKREWIENFIDRWTKNTPKNSLVVSNEGGFYL